MKTLSAPSRLSPTAGRAIRGGPIATLAAVCFLALASHPAAAADDEGPEMRVFVGLKSADAILADLKTIVGGLAGEEEAYEELIYPNIEIFLVGVDTSRTIRFDLVQPAEGDSRLNMAIPLEDTKDFLRDNLEPIGIEYKRRSSDFYELSEVYDGWMRIIDDYGVIAKSPFKGDAAAGLPSPADADPRLFEKPADVSILIDMESGTPQQRREVAEAIGRKRVENLSRRDGESDAAFNLRKTMAENRAEHLPKILGGLKRMLLGYETVDGTGEGRSHVIVEAAEGTELKELIDGVGTPEFLFAGVPSTDDPVYTGRLAWPMTEARKARWSEALEASRDVAADQLDEQDPAPSDDRRAAQGELSDGVYDFLKANLDQPLLGVFTEMRASGGKTYSAAAGMQSVDGTALVAVLEKLPAASDGATVETAVETVGDVSLHKVTLPGLSQPIQDFLGGTTVTIGTSPTAVYVAGGPDGVQLLKDSLEGLEAAPTETVLSLRAHLSPVAELLDSVATRRDVSLIQFMQARREERLERRQDAAGARRLQVTDPAAWREAALKALKGKPDDVLSLELKKVDDRLEGDSRVGRSILGAVGELIAKFAKENL